MEVFKFTSATRIDRRILYFQLLIVIQIHDTDESFSLNIYLFIYSNFSELSNYKTSTPILPIISRTKKKKNPETIRSNGVSSSFSSNAVCTCKSETMGGAKSRHQCLEELGYRSNLIRVFEIDAYPPWSRWRALFSSVLSHRYPPLSPRYIMVALYKPHDTVQPLSSSDKQAHPCRGRASSLRHLSNLFHRMTRDLKKERKEHGVQKVYSRTILRISRIYQFFFPCISLFFIAMEYLEVYWEIEKWFF